MPAETFVRQGGSFRKVGQNGIYTRVAGTWQQCDFAYTRVAGTWRTVYVRDTTGPAAPTNVQGTWNGTVGGVPRLNITFTKPPDADYAGMFAQWKPRSSPSWQFATLGSSPSSIQVLGNIFWQITDFVLTPFDEFGNNGTSVASSSMAWTGTSRGPVPSPVVVDPSDSGSFTLTGGPYLSGVRVRQGTWSGTEYAGVYFYPGLYPLLRGSTVSSASVQMFRTNAGETGGVFPYMWRSIISSKAQSPWGFMEQGPADGTSPMGGDFERWAYQPIPSNWFNNMTDPSQQRLNSIALYSQGLNLTRMELFGAGEAPGTVVPGRLTISHSG